MYLKTMNRIINENGKALSGISFMGNTNKIGKVFFKDENQNEVFIHKDMPFNKELNLHNISPDDLFYKIYDFSHVVDGKIVLYVKKEWLMKEEYKSNNHSEDKMVIEYEGYTIVQDC